MDSFGPSGDEDSGYPTEPLRESAPLAWAEAPQRCYRHPETGATCLSYHRVWQYLRLLGVISSIRTNTEFLTTRFRECARTGDFPRVLVSATADYSMLGHLASAYRLETSAFDATVVDRCETSLLLNRWYADRYDLGLTTVCDDLLSYTTQQPFDLVCTHNLLGRFDTAARSRLIAQWGALLRPGGIVVTTQRVRPNSVAVLTGYSPAQIEQFVDRVVKAARAHTPPLGVDEDELAHATREYLLGRRNHVIRMPGEITDPFEAAGFDVELADTGDGAERRSDLPPADAGKGSYRMRIVARKQ